MNALAARRAPSRGIWESIPLEVFASACAIILAGVLKLAGILP